MDSCPHTKESSWNGYFWCHKLSNKGTCTCSMKALRRSWKISRVFLLSCLQFVCVWPSKCGSVGRHGPDGPLFGHFSIYHFTSARFQFSLLSSGCSEFGMFFLYSMSKVISSKSTNLPLHWSLAPRFCHIFIYLESLLKKKWLGDSARAHTGVWLWTCAHYTNGLVVYSQQLCC